MNENNSGRAVPFRIWTRHDWWDLEPDRFRMEVINAEGEAEKFLVASGNATWLNIQQAREVREHLDQCIALIEKD